MEKSRLVGLALSVASSLSLTPTEETVKFSDIENSIGNSFFSVGNSLNSVGNSLNSIGNYFVETWNKEPIEGELIIPKFEKYDPEKHPVISPTDFELRVQERVKFYMNNLYHGRLVGMEMYKTKVNLGVDLPEYSFGRHVSERIAHSSLEGMGLHDATSSVYAKGPWQYMIIAALEDGLKVDLELGIDERTDPLKADAASSSRLNRSWFKYEGREDLAYWDYLMGATRLKEKIEEAGSDHPDSLMKVLSPETFSYPYEIVAIAYMERNPEETGFISDASVMNSIVEGFRIDYIREGENLGKFSKRVGRNPWHIRDANPQITDIGKLYPGQEMNVHTFKVLY